MGIQERDYMRAGWDGARRIAARATGSAYRSPATSARRSFDARRSTSTRNFVRACGFVHAIVFLVPRILVAGNDWSVLWLPTASKTIWPPTALEAAFVWPGFALLAVLASSVKSLFGRGLVFASLSGFVAWAVLEKGLGREELQTVGVLLWWPAQLGVLIKYALLSFTLVIACLLGAPGWLKVRRVGGFLAFVSIAAYLAAPWLGAVLPEPVQHAETWLDPFRRVASAMPLVHLGGWADVLRVTAKGIWFVTLLVDVILLLRLASRALGVATARRGALDVLDPILFFVPGLLAQVGWWCWWIGCSGLPFGAACSESWNALLSVVSLGTGFLLVGLTVGCALASSLEGE